MKKPKVFEYMVVFNPTEEQVKEGMVSKILFYPSQILGVDLKDASQRAMDAIPPAIKDAPFDLLIQEWGH